MENIFALEQLGIMSERFTKLTQHWLQSGTRFSLTQATGAKMTALTTAMAPPREWPTILTEWLGKISCSLTILARRLSTNHLEALSTP
eukprot:CAMPEP_0114634964 /NCGR_PEP_ID=MMETSP0168-20121206/16243_1 /TAXON_ID=95228 ORGANISM="Vannella sp., Strain DIVA3 517/6/12" /NCGR_SAMPLE_ID=MMETSP0168 /ASSEMBLY_ACC=CAM_ASM_000044 /LENGTH=87 /DNA_ID=CAMNT_0001846665 /DNA_START=292 /DNA_END=552 /DNA_ORIENTATION=+